MALSLQLACGVTASVGAEVGGVGVREGGGVFDGGRVEVTKRGAVGVAFAFEMVMHPLNKKAAVKIIKRIFRMN